MLNWQVQAADGGCVSWVFTLLGLLVSCWPLLLQCGGASLSTCCQLEPRRVDIDFSQTDLYAVIFQFSNLLRLTSAAKGHTLRKTHFVVPCNIICLHLVNATRTRENLPFISLLSFYKKKLCKWVICDVTKGSYSSLGPFSLRPLFYLSFEMNASHNVLVTVLKTVLVVGLIRLFFPTIFNAFNIIIDLWPSPLKVGDTKSYSENYINLGPRRQGPHFTENLFNTCFPPSAVCLPNFCSPLHLLQLHFY